jgi:hypothetical protein
MLPPELVWSPQSHTADSTSQFSLKLADALTVV